MQRQMGCGDDGIKTDVYTEHVWCGRRFDTCGMVGVEVVLLCNASVGKDEIDTVLG